MSLFSEEYVNTGRQIEFDIAKAICIIGMVFVHVYEFFLPVEAMSFGLQNALVNVIQMLVGAPCFMICMGIGIAYTTKNSSDNLLKRGLKIFILGYVLNIFRVCIIYLIGIAVGYYPKEMFVSRMIYSLLNTDIMQFAGLALMLMGLLKRFKLNDKQILFTSIIMSLIGSFIKTFDMSNMLNYIVGLFLGTFNFNFDMVAGYFPLFNWFIFVAFGYCFGNLFRKCNDKKKFYLIVSSICAVIVTIYLVIAIPNKIGMINPDHDFVNYYHLTTFDALFSMMATLVIFGVYYALSFVLPKFVTDFTSITSKNINKIYCIHWIFVGNISAILEIFTDNRFLNQGTCVVLAIGLFIISYIIAYYYDKSLKLRVKNG